MKHIKEAAILHEGKVYTGRRHHNVIAKIIKETGVDHVFGKQGFVTDDDEFLDREEAAKVALACGQIKKLKYHSKQLFSEDLY
jgi:hypothetical protein